MKRFVTIVHALKPLTAITKRSILDVAAVLDPPLWSALKFISNLESISNSQWRIHIV